MGVSVQRRQRQQPQTWEVDDDKTSYMYAHDVRHGSLRAGSLPGAQECGGKSGGDLTPATPSAGRGFGSDLAILGANPRRE